MGWIYSAFYLSYTLCMLPCGHWIDRVGPKRALLYFALFSGWSVILMGIAGMAMAASTALLGDAIHSVKPYFGLGVNSAFEDVTVLSQALDDAPSAAAALEGGGGGARRLARRRALE